MTTGETSQPLPGTLDDGIDAKKADAAFKMALARFSSPFSRRSRFTSPDSCRTHLRTVSALPTPSSCDTWFIAAHSDSC